MDPQRGVSFRIRYHSQTKIDGQPVKVLGDWSGIGTLVADRGRFDFTQGRGPGTVDTADYYLFDKEETLVVRASERSARLRDSQAGKTIALPDSDVAEATSAIDVIAEQETCGPFVTRHVRLTVSHDFDGASSVGSTEPIITTVRQITDYWFADEAASLAHVLKAIAPAEYPLGAAAAARVNQRKRDEILAIHRGLVRQRITLNVSNFASHIVTTKEVSIDEYNVAKVDLSRLTLPATVRINGDEQTESSKRWLSPPVP